MTTRLSNFDAYRRRLAGPVADGYDPMRHVTALRLRDLGFGLCEDVGDDAFVTREAVGLRRDEVLLDGSVQLGLEVLVPFAGNR